MKKISLGSNVEDPITGFKGVAIARAEYMYGCGKILVQPEGLNEGKIISSEWIDEPRLDVIKDKDMGVGFTS
jgi:hypothetical protein